MSMLLERTELFDPIAKRLGDGMPALGTCAGMILLADRVLDGRDDQRSFAAIDITVRRNAFGRQVDSFESDLDVDGFSRAVPRRVHPCPDRRGRRRRRRRCSPVSTDARCSATSGSRLVASFHPELAADQRVHRLFLDLVEHCAPPRRHTEPTRNAEEH